MKILRFLLKTHCRRRGWWYHVPHSSIFCVSHCNVICNAKLFWTASLRHPLIKYDTVVTYCITSLFSKVYTICTWWHLHHSDRSNGRFFQTQNNTIPSSNVHNFWWIYEMYVSGHVLRKIFALTRYASGYKCDECKMFIVYFVGWNLMDYGENIYFPKQTWHVVLIL